MARVLGAVVAAALVAACGGSSKSGGGGGAQCKVAASLGALGTVAGSVTGTGSGTDILWSGDLNAETTPDRVAVELYDTFGVFAGGITPGVYSLSGDELNYATCGLCVLLLGDADPVTGEPAAYYMATGGVVEVLSVAGTLTLALDSVTFHEVTIDPSTFESTPVGSCTATITSMSVNDPLPP